MAYLCDLVQTSDGDKACISVNNLECLSNQSHDSFLKDLLKQTSLTHTYPVFIQASTEDLSQIQKNSHYSSSLIRRKGTGEVVGQISTYRHQWYYAAWKHFAEIEIYHNFPNPKRSLLDAARAIFASEEAAREGTRDLPYRAVLEKIRCLFIEKDRTEFSSTGGESTISANLEDSCTHGQHQEYHPELDPGYKVENPFSKSID